ncbi:Uncharacterized protein conserved in bacteria DUF374 [Elusimicrobium minutum Pei191]|uniref:Uncharacterized protein conserved in bacteria DUF374 n=1 Tax=Elusimicrobium minutum (strain Pei191) TaxID=445932 RepID=B2KBY8_ELUMP|nr:lysophospholipid acyltransferase family protein [Elusimicrobium minutum]ACC98115.1 Uncharacterized protein conserved in bacteria DUF374 [Elusimicrobium minutum Pei191]
MRKISSTKTSIKSPHRSMKYVIVSYFIYLASCFMGWTTRTKFHKTKEFEEWDKSGKNYIYAIWHNQQAFLLYPYRGQRICVLISLSKDGEYIARVLPKFKMKAVRGSTSKGGANALRNLIDLSQAGYHPMITPDGPRGPIYKVQQGVIYLALKTGLPIVPVGAGLSNKFTVRSWDKMRIPLPFGKCALVYGNMIHVSKEDDKAQIKLKLELELNAATLKAEQLVS